MSKIALDEFVTHGLLPARVSKTGAPGEPLLEVVIADSISGGANYENNMPARVSLIRRLSDGTEYRAIYAQCPPEPDEPLVDDEATFKLPVEGGA